MQNVKVNCKLIIVTVLFYSTFCRRKFCVHRVYSSLDGKFWTYQNTRLRKEEQLVHFKIGDSLITRVISRYLYDEYTYSASVK